MVNLLTPGALCRVGICFCMLAVLIMAAPDAISQTISVGNGYYPYTIARAQDREWIRSMPMEHRPNRPLHFYGNKVRRQSVQRPTYVAPPKTVANPLIPRRTALKRLR